jgi:hypothetical protein
MAMLSSQLRRQTAVERRRKGTIKVSQARDHKKLGWAWIFTIALPHHVPCAKAPTLIPSPSMDSQLWRLSKITPKAKMIYFRGIKGQAIHQQYMDMMDKDGNVKTIPTFANINVQTPKYTFSHPASLLFATQFAQFAPARSGCHREGCL